MLSLFLVVCGSTVSKFGAGFLFKEYHLLRLERWLSVLRTFAVFTEDLNSVLGTQIVVHRVLLPSFIEDLTLSSGATILMWCT